MATTTPNYGWPVPTSTDLVKDGAVAIEALGDAIDATVFGLGTGLTLITTQAFTTAAAVNINNCFTSTYTNYRLLITAQGSAGTNLNFRYRVSGVDNSATIYARQFLRAISTGVSGSFDTLNEVTVSSLSSTQTAMSFVEIRNPNLAVQTNSFATFHDNDYVGHFGCLHKTATAFDGFSLYGASGTITGSVWVYGYEKV